MPLTGILPEHLQGRGTDAALGGRRRPDEGRIVVFIGEQAQVTGQILDFSLVEK